MRKVFKVLIFTDLDGSLLHRDTFEFGEIKDYLKQIISKGIFVISINKIGFYRTTRSQLEAREIK